MPSLLITSAPQVTLGLGLSLRVNVGAAVAIDASLPGVVVAAAAAGAAGTAVGVIVVVTDALLLFACCTAVSAMIACLTLEAGRIEAFGNGRGVQSVVLDWLK